MRDFTRDLLFAMRGALRRPGYSFAVVATLAIGIGANTAIFSIFNWILFRPLPGVARPAELVTIRYQTASREGSFFIAYRDHADLEAAATSSFTGLATATPWMFDMLTATQTERVDAEVVTTNYLSLLGVTPVLGRDFRPEEQNPGSAPSAIISRRLWRQTYASDHGVLGRTITLNGRPFAIVGVAPAGFQGRSLMTAADVWMPLGSYATLQPEGRKELLSSRQETMFSESFGRLRQGATLAQAQAEATTAVDNMPAFANRSKVPGRRSGLGPVVYPSIGLEKFTQERLNTVFRLLMGAVGLLLLLACANAANLLLARATARRREIAVCQAIGASRFRIVRQQLAEGLVLSLAAGATGLLLAIWLTWIFDGMRIISFMPAITGVGIDWRVCAFALAASVATGILFATAPAITSSRVDLQTSLKDGVTTSAHGRKLLRGSLVMIQISVSVLLLIAAGLFVRTLQNIRGLDLGIRPDGVVSFSIQPNRFGLNRDRSQAFVRDLLQRVRSSPGVDSAAFAWTTPFSQNRADSSYARPETPETFVSSASSAISPGYFSTMGIPLLAGRDFTEADTREASETSGIVIVSRRFAEEIFPAGGALGSRLVMKYPKGKIVEVVGIVGDVRGRAMTEEPEGWTYSPAVKPTWGTVQVRSSLPAGQTIAAIRAAARQIDPVVAPHDIENFGAAVDRALSEQRLFARVSSIFAAVAALLAGIGIYGMMAGSVLERRKEFGIRLALGARSEALLALVLRSAITLAVVGLAVGLGGAALLQRVIQSRLFGVTPLDPAVIAMATVGILTVSFAASLVPALRAARVDPVKSLRVE